ncbi:MAG: small basic protein [Tepidisphaerales bacterium]
MSLDRSLKSASGLVRHRNVLTRPERLLRLQAEERWNEEKPVLGLPKVANRKAAVGKSAKKAEAAPADAKAAAKPAAGAAAAKPAAAAGAAKPAAAAGSAAKKK